MKVKAQLFELLELGPMTTGEIAALMGVKCNRACSYLLYMHQIGAVKREKFVKPKSSAPGSRHVWLWSLAP